MKKFSILSLILSLFFLRAYPQTCPSPSAFSELNVSNVRARINSGMDAFWDLVGSAQYEIPKGSNMHSMFAHSIWIGGYDGTNLKVAGQTYRQSGGTDFYSGPVNAPDCIPYDRIWNIYRDTLDEFLYQYSIGNVTNGTYPVPKDIKEWPAYDSVAMTYTLAPFFDTNGDGEYNPYDGDFPLIRGDQMLYEIANEKYTHYETGGAPLGVEFHYSAYAYKCPADTGDENILNNTTFYNLRIINRSVSTLDNVYVGLWYDVDLGCFIDDYVGCDTTLNLAYAYNGDSADFNCGSNGYGLNPPAVGSVILRGPKNEFGNDLRMTGFSHYYGSADPCCGNPDNALDYYYYISGYWADGVHLVDDYNQCNDGSANGYNPSCTAYTNFIYPGDPVTQTGWTEYNAGIPPYDRRFLQSTGPFKLLSGAENEIDYAIVWSRDTTLNNFQQVGKLRSDVQKIQQWFDAGVGPCGSLLSVRIQVPSATLESLTIL